MTLTAQNLTVQIGSSTLLENVTLELPAGELLAVIGPNGAGKSTLLKALAGEIKPNGGQVRLDDKPLERWTPLELAKRRAVLPQDSTLEFNFTAFEVALLGRNPFITYRETPHDLAIAHAALRQVDAAHLETRAYPTLSGGERQRVQLARVLAQIWGEDMKRTLETNLETNLTASTAGKFLLLDEPTSSLDLAHQHETLAVAKGLTRNGVGVLAVLHDLNLAAQYADRVLILHGGTVLTAGTPKDVFQPELIFEAFRIPVLVQAHPCLECPLIVPVPQIQILETQHLQTQSSRA